MQVLFLPSQVHFPDHCNYSSTAMFHHLTYLAMVLTVVAIREVRGQQNDDPEPGTGEDRFMGSGPYQYYNPGHGGAILTS